MGVVYRSERLSDGAVVAVKVIAPEQAAEPEYRRRLRSEARRAIAVRHPGIVRVLDVGQHGELIWIEMELVAGPDLQSLVDDRGPLPPGVAAEVVAQVADALSAVHAAGIVHADVKPANVLLQERSETPAAGGPATVPRARLTDFGVAHRPAGDDGVGLSDATAWIGTSTDLASPHARAGTLAYMAPEQWRGDPLDARTDVYSLGATLYTALTGRRPFPQVSLPELVYAASMTEPPPPSSVVPDVPAALDAVVATAMAKDSARRYADAADMARAVRAAMAAVAAPVSSGTGAGRAGHLARWRVPALVAALAAAVTLGAVGLTRWSPWTPSGQDHVAGVPTLRRTVCADDLTLRDRPAGASTHTLVRGDLVTVRLDRTSGPWRYIRADDGAEGWALSQYLRSSCPEPSGAPSPRPTP